MTISTTDSKIQYNGNGVTLAFAFPYRFLQNADLNVILISAAGLQTTQMLNTDYTVTGAGLDAGGTVTMVVAPPSGSKLLIRRVVQLTQETDYISGDPFPAESHERALDKLTMGTQQLQEQVTRSVILPVDNTTFDAELPAIVADRYLRTNNAGTAFELVDIVAPGELVVSPFIETLLDDTTAADARTTLGAQVAGSYANSGAVGSSGLTMTTARVLGRTTAGTGAPEELTAAQVRTLLSLVAIATSGSAADITTGDLAAARIAAALNASGAAPFFACRAWVNFNGTGTVAIRASGNVSSITDNGVGDYTVNFTTAMPDANYVGTGLGSTIGTDGRRISEGGAARTTTAFRVSTENSAGANTDATHVNLAFFR